MNRSAIFLITSLLMMWSPMTLSADPEPDVLSPFTGLFPYEIGGSRALPPPSTRMKTYRVIAHFKAGFEFSCGEFDFKDNLSKMLNGIEDSFERMPDQLVSGLTGAIASLPN